MPRGSWDAQVLDEIAPAEDEMIFRKTSSNVFVSTNLDYVLRNLGVRSLIVAGIMTDQCVEIAVRDACDLGYLVSLVTDACTTTSVERHEQSLIGIRGYCRQRTTSAVLWPRSLHPFPSDTNSCGIASAPRDPYPAGFSTWPPNS